MKKNLIYNFLFDVVSIVFLKNALIDFFESWKFFSDRLLLNQLNYPRIEIQLLIKMDSWQA